VEFYDYLTVWGAMRRVPAYERVDEAEFYSEFRDLTFREAVLSAGIRQNPLTSVIWNIQLACEWEWIDKKRPYYKIYPDLLPCLTTTKLTVPNQYLQLPFPSILIRLPKDHGMPELAVDEKHFVRAILAADGGKRKALMFGNENFIPQESDRRSITVWIDIGEAEGMPNCMFPVYTYQQLLFEDDNQTVEEALEWNVHHTTRNVNGFLHDGGVPVPIELIDRCLRIVTAVSFLATGGDKIVEFDVLSRDLDRFVRARRQEDRAAQEQIITRAIRNHKHGWTVGRELLFPARRESHSDNGQVGKDSELNFQHQRSAHWHWVRYGPGKHQLKLLFYKQLTVRPDLPINPDARRGYHPG
jgi:hypothetical protein